MGGFGMPPLVPHAEVGNKGGFELNLVAHAPLSEPVKVTNPSPLPVEPEPEATGGTTGEL